MIDVYDTLTMQPDDDKANAGNVTERWQNMAQFADLADAGLTP